MQGFATAAVLVLFFTLNQSGEKGQAYANGFTDAVGSPGEDQATQLSSLLDHLDTYYTLQCLRVVISDTISMNSSPTKSLFPILNTTSSRKTIKHPVNIWDNVDRTGSKAKMEILISPGTVEEVQETINYIHWKTEKVNAKSCVTYMLLRPPDKHLLNLLTDRRPKKRLTRYFLVHAENNTAAESFLLDQQLRKEENVVALVQEQSHNSTYWRVLIRQLLHPSGSPQVLTVNRWFRDTGLTSTENIFPEQMANFYGQLLTGGLMDYIPYSDYQTFEGSLYVKYKPCVNRYIIEALAQLFNFTYQMKLPADGRWGSLVDGHYVGVVGDVEFERTLFAFDITVTMERSQNVDFTEYYSIQAVSFLTAKSRPDPLWRKLVTPFRGTVWVCVLVSVGGGALLYHIIYYMQASLASSHLSSHAFMQVLASFLSQSLHNYNSLQAGRVFLGFWFIYAFLVTSYYKTSLTSTLTVPFVPPTIDTVEELAQAGLYNGMIASKGMAYTLFATSEDLVYKQITQQMEFMSSISEIMKKVVGGQYSFIQFTGILDLLLGVYNSNPQRKTDIHLARDMLYPSGIACAIPQGAPHLRTFSAGLQRLLKAGLISKWIKDLSPLYLKTLIGDDLDEDDDVTRTTREVKLSLDHLQGPFFILFFGFVGGSLLLVSEILFVACGRASTG